MGICVVCGTMRAGNGRGGHGEGRLRYPHELVRHVNRASLQSTNSSASARRFRLLFSAPSHTPRLLNPPTFFWPARRTRSRMKRCLAPSYVRSHLHSSASSARSGPVSSWPQLGEPWAKEMTLEIILRGLGRHREGTRHDERPVLVLQDQTDGVGLHLPL